LIDMGLEAVLPGPQNALYVMLCYVSRRWWNVTRMTGKSVHGLWWNCAGTPMCLYISWCYSPDGPV